MKAVVSRHRNTLHHLTLMLVQYVVCASALSEEYLQKSPHSVVVTYVLFCRLLPKSGLPTDWLPTDWLPMTDCRKTNCRMTDCRKTNCRMTDCRKTNCPKTSGISRFLYKFQLSNEKRRFLLVRMLNFVISNWSKVTILNTLNELVSIYVTLLPLLQPVWTPTRVTLGCLNGQAWLIWNPF